MSRNVDITFACLPLRTVSRLDVPLDASPKFREQCERIKSAIERHGTHNTYYLHNARCVYCLTNRDDVGMVEFTFEGTVFTDENDQKTERCELHVHLSRETCDWLTEPVVEWFKETVIKAVAVEFDRYIAAGDLQQAVQRMERIRAESDKHGGYVGMYL
ncbi:MAG: hypothetical protein HYS13_04345 [Planctomycetia bacterium]|nr:hypothetical protein [Planctomycetia bacterium]